MGADGTVIARAIDRWGPAPRVLAVAFASAGERELAHAARGYQMAYSACCEWSDLRA